jgi:hypothetical protein
VASTRVGGHYRDGTALATPALLARVDCDRAGHGDLPRRGRFDVRYVRRGRACSAASSRIMEVNGAGSEAVHAWDPRLSHPRCVPHRVRQANARCSPSPRPIAGAGHPPGGRWRALARLYSPPAAGLIARYTRRSN